MLTDHQQNNADIVSSAARTPAAVLSQLFGYSDFRAGQEDVISEILAGRDVLAVMPTGAGKSVCYQIPALLSEGVTIVVSPLISLMKDQVAGLSAAGVDAAMLNSAQGYEEYMDTLRELSGGRRKIVYVAPERLESEEFVAAVCRLPVSIIAVDEAHCISQWGQNFRPSYLNIASFSALFEKRPVLAAFTATATGRVREDICARLSLQNPFEIVTGFGRDNLYFAVRTPQGKARELLGYLAANRGKAGIVYCSTRKTVDELTERLCAKGIPAVRYHAGLGDAERRKNQEAFQFDRVDVMVATNAFGMGIDKSNVSFVIHYNMPKDVESYYQEAGRAGRDGSPADCILYYSGQDVHTNQFLIRKSVEENEELTSEQRRAILASDEERLRHMTFYATTDGCLRAFILKYFGEQSAPFCGHCGNCDAEYEELEVTEDARAALNCIHHLAQRRLAFGKSLIAQMLHGGENERIRSYRLDRMDAWGMLKHVPTHRITKMLDYLIAEGYLRVTEDKYPVLSLAPDAPAHFKAQGSLVMKLPKEKPRKREKDAGVRGGVSGNQVDAGLFERLRALRRKLADAAGIPAFVVFPDASLRDMCHLLPQTLEAFLLVSGVGAMKCERYGEAFVSEIQRYVAESED
ncbi:MAG: DNA helicase RecQ [Clostridiales Family XIII bacterium]|jgi:ATP-dependent DNA helicase RecQ|nr:DNA helicase RecQ [Clostridiales Family XIII bacterium]